MSTANQLAGIYLSEILVSCSFSKTCNQCLQTDTEKKQ